MLAVCSLYPDGIASKPVVLVPGLAAHKSKDLSLVAGPAVPSVISLQSCVDIIVKPLGAKPLESSIACLL